MVDHDEMKEQIIVAARKVFAQYGYRKTTIEDIASAVYKAKSSVYHYFNGKEDIFKAVIEREAAQIFRKVNETIRNESTPVGKFNMYFKTINQEVKETKNYFRLLMDEWFSVFDFTREVKKSHEKQSLNDIVSILREGNAVGVFEVANPEESAKAIIAAFTGFWYPLSLEPDVAHIDSLLNILLRGLLKR